MACQREVGSRQAEVLKGVRANKTKLRANQPKMARPPSFVRTSSVQSPKQLVVLLLCVILQVKF